MSAKDVFGLIVRTGGLASCAYGTYLLVNGVWGMFTGFAFGGFPSYSLSGIFVYLFAPAAVWIIAGALLMRWPDRIVRFAYPLRSGTCAKCGYDMRATPDRCPECGAVPEA